VTPQSTRSFLFIAGEASGDTLGAELVRSLKAANSAFIFFGAGGPKMEAAGVDLAFDLSAHAVVGIWEVLKNYGKFKRFFDQLIDLTFERRPDFVVLIDYPGFNLRFAKALKERLRRTGEEKWHPRIVYYISPQIWAWHGSRVHQIARDVDLMLAIFPFEKGWYAERKPEFRVEFVGHPIIDRYAREAVPIREQANERTLLLLPGSRVREVRKHLPVMLAAAERLASEEKVRIEMVLPNESLHQLARDLIDLSRVRVRIGELGSALSSATAAVASSGTVTMECACFLLPTVVIYKTSWSTYLLGRRFIRVKYLAMPNLLADQEIYPEFIQGEATSENIYKALKELLTEPTRRASIQENLKRVIATLGERGASDRAAHAILSLSSAD
jgi:lipid-A-disaccharide synthase